MDPRDRYFMTRQRVDERRAGVQRARLVRGEWAADQPPTPILARLELLPASDPNRPSGLPLVRRLAVIQLARAARDA
jgi:hypothetical protein